MSILAGLSAIFGVLGAGFGVFQGLHRSWDEQEDIAAKREYERQTREMRIKNQQAHTNREIGYSIDAFEKEREDAFRKADDIWHQGERIDMRSDLDETLTGRAFNLAMQKNNLENESLLLQQQRGRQEFVNRQGAQVAALGTSGARAGANSAEQLLTQNEANFNQDLDLMSRQRETQKEINLMQAVSSLKSGMFRIDEQRDQANMAFRDSTQLRDDYTGEIVDKDFGLEIEAVHKDYEAKKDLARSLVFYSLQPKEVEDLLKQFDTEEQQKIEEIKTAHAQKSNTGGRVVKLFNKKLYNARADLADNIDLQNLDGGFKQAALQRAYDRAQYTVIDGITDAFKGLDFGMKAAGKVADFANNWGDGGSAGNTMAMNTGRAAGGKSAFSLGFGNEDALYGRVKRYKDPFGFMFG